MTLSNLVQTLVTILVALAVTVGTLLTASAAGQWQQSVRDEIKRSAAMVEDVRFVYGDEAPVALELALAEAREAELRGGDSKTEREAVFALRQEYSAKLIGGRYGRPGKGYDVAGRLTDVRERNRDLTALDPEAALASGDRRNRVALIILIASIPFVLVFVIADLILRRRASTTSAATDQPEDVELVPRPWSSPTPRRLWVSIALGAWLVITLLPALQVHYASKEQRAQALAARKASEVSTALEASGLVSSFRSNSKQRVAWMETHAVAREIVATDTTDAEAAARLRADARTEQAVSERAKVIVTAMSRPPSAADGVDAATRRAVNASVNVADDLRKEQNTELERAQQAGTRANRVTVAVLLGALAASLCVLAAAARAVRGTSLDLAAGGVLVVSLATLASVPFL